MSRVEKPKPREDAEAKIMEPLLPPRFQRGQSYPDSVTADEKGPLSSPDTPGFVLLGKSCPSASPTVAGVGTISVFECLGLCFG